MSLPTKLLLFPRASIQAPNFPLFRHFEAEETQLIIETNSKRFSASRLQEKILLVFLNLTLEMVIKWSYWGRILILRLTLERGMYRIIINNY